MSFRVQVRFASFCSLLAVATIACAREDADEDDGGATTTSALQAQSQAGLVDAVADIESGVAPEPEEAARIVTEQPTRGLQPEGCARKTRVGSVVTFVSDGCTGAFGKVAVYGTLVATFSKTAPDVLHVSLTANDGATSNGGAFTYASETSIRYEGASRILTYRGSSSGTTARGRAFARTTELTVSADTQTRCAAINGASRGTVGRYDVNLTLEGLHGCRNACPTAGVARATVNGPLVKDASVTVTFDGSDRARVKVDARRDRELTVALDCAAAEAD